MKGYALCKPCALFDALVEKALPIRGACTHCGAPDQVLYRCDEKPGAAA